MPAKYSFTEGDTGSVLRVTCKNDDDKSIIILTGATVRLKWNDAAGTLQDKTMSIDDAANGLVSYQFQANELEAGDVDFEVEITDSAGKLLHSLSLLNEKVRKALA